MMSELSKKYAIAIRRRNNGDFFFDDSKYEFSLCDTLITPYCWAADPFLFEHEQSLYLFYEWFDMRTEKGKIAYSICDKNTGKLSCPRVILDEKYHCSFPYVFRKEDIVYLMPETSQTNEQKLFKAISFPNEWIEVEPIISDIFTCDSILLNPNLLLTSTMFRPTHPDTVQSCYVSNQLFEVFYEKDKNSNLLLQDDCGTGDYGVRNAGKVFEYNGFLIRPGQDCTKNRYGHGVVFWKIESYNPYKEELLRVVDEQEIFNHLLCDRSFKYCGFHTYNISTDYEVIDIAYMEKTPLEIKWKQFIRRKKAKKEKRKRHNIYKNSFKTLNAYIIENDIESIAIYGLGEYGELFYRNHSCLRASLIYGIDSKRRTFHDLRIYTPSESLPSVDLIIITIDGKSNEMISVVKGKGSRVVSWSDFIN